MDLLHGSLAARRLYRRVRCILEMREYAGTNDDDDDVRDTGTPLRGAESPTSEIRRTSCDNQTLFEKNRDKLRLSASFRHLYPVALLPKRSATFSRYDLHLFSTFISLATRSIGDPLVRRRRSFFSGIAGTTAVPSALHCSCTAPYTLKRNGSMFLVLERKRGRIGGAKSSTSTNFLK